MKFRKLRYGLPAIVGMSLVALMGAQCQPQKPPGTFPTPTTQVGPGDPGVNPCTLPAAGLSPFTQDELDNNWEEDRRFPTGGVTSVTFDGCDNVAEIGIDSSQAHPTSGFHRTEGIKTLGANMGNAVQIHLYIDPAWQETAVRAGLWVVGGNNAGGRDDLYGIIEFTNLEPITGGPDLGPNAADFEGFRFWDTDLDVWTESGAAFTYGDWATLRIELDAANEEYDYFINGVLIGSGPGGVNFIWEAFINQYNFGLNEFANLSNDSYSTHWLAGI